jgi:AGZA family xanthine/uracil permease-like MFS transporter
VLFTAASYHSPALQEKEIKSARFTTEIRAGLTTFFTMAYVISVNVRVEGD